MTIERPTVEEKPAMTPETLEKAIESVKQQIETNRNAGRRRLEK